jgi:hypothetical protein
MTVDDDFLKAQRQIVERLNLAPGERYGGVIQKHQEKRGQLPVLSHAIVLLPGEVQEVTWDEAHDWAASVGGALPTPRELGLLLAKDLVLGLAKRAPWFQRAHYWTATEDPEDFTLAWSIGHRRSISPHPSASYDAKICQLRARAVRRVPAAQANRPVQGCEKVKG